jgi:hypothetical protein
MNRVHWSLVITELSEAGIDLRAQARRAQVSLGTVYYWRQGGQPKHHNGQMLLDLYVRETGKPPPIQTTLTST